MRIVVGHRGSGRSTKMIDWLREGNNSLTAGEVRVLLCHTADAAMQMYRSTFDADGNSDLESWQFVTLADVTKPGALSGVRHVARQQVVLGIDNLDVLLRQIIQYFPIEVATLEDHGVEHLETADL